jgi:hypothetical protein
VRRLTGIGQWDRVERQAGQAVVGKGSGRLDWYKSSAKLTMAFISESTFLVE